MTKESRHFFPEAQERGPRRPAKILFVRHGEPMEYAVKDAGLSEVGREQVREYARKYIGQIKAELREGRRIAIKILYSDLRRTSESAQVFLDELEQCIQHEHIDGVRILVPRKREQLKTTETLGPLINAGIPKGDAFPTWMAAEDNDLANIGSRTPEEIYDVLEKFVDQKDELAERIGSEGEELNYVCWTHETAHGGLLRGLGLDSVRPNFAEPIEVDIDTLGKRKVVFRNVEITQPKEENPNV